MVISLLSVDLFLPLSNPLSFISTISYYTPPSPTPSHPAITTSGLTTGGSWAPLCPVLVTSTPCQSVTLMESPRKWEMAPSQSELCTCNRTDVHMYMYIYIHVYVLYSYEFFVSSYWAIISSFYWKYIMYISPSIHKYMHPAIYDKLISISYFL